MKKKFLTAILLSVGMYFSYAQNAWESFKENDYKKAKELFKKQLSSNPSDEDALKGLSLIAVLEGDAFKEVDYLNKYLTSSNDEAYFWTVPGSDINVTSPDMAFPNKNLGYTNLANKWFAYNQKVFNKDRKGADTYYTQNIDNLDWSFVGPFYTTNKYGFWQDYPVEKEGYSDDKSYETGYYGMTASWKHLGGNTTPLKSYLDNSGVLNTTDVFYANTFFQLNSAQKVHLNISRQEPAKVWIDGKLVFEHSESVYPIHNNESVVLDLPSGWHRILVKLLPYSRDLKYTTIDNEASNYKSNYINGRFFEKKKQNAKNITEWFGKRLRTGSLNTQTGMLVQVADEKGNLLPVKSQHQLPSSVKSVTKVTPSKQSLYVNAINNWNQGIKSKYFDLYMAYLAARKEAKLFDFEKVIKKEYNENSSNDFVKFIYYSTLTNISKTTSAEKMLSSISKENSIVRKEVTRDNEVSKEELEAELKQLENCCNETPFYYALKLKYNISYASPEVLQKYVNFLEKEYSWVSWYNLLTWDEYSKYKKLLPKKTEAQKKKELKKEKKAYAKVGKTKFSPYLQRRIIQHMSQDQDVMGVYRLVEECLELSDNDFDLENAYLSMKLDRTNDTLAVIRQLSTFDSKYYMIPSKYKAVGETFEKLKDTTNVLKYYEMALPYTYSGKSDLAEKIEDYKNNSYELIYDQEYIDSIITKYGNVEKYKDDNTVYIIDCSENYHISPSQLINDEGIVIVKILKEEAIQEWTEPDFGYLPSIESVKVYKKNGTRVPAENRGSSVVISNLEVGDIIVARGHGTGIFGQRASQTRSIKFYSEFDKPVAHSNFTVTLPKKFKHTTYSHLCEKNKSVKESGTEKIYSWNFVDLPAYEKVEAVTAKSLAKQYVEISSAENWDGIIEYYRYKLYSGLADNENIQEVLDTIITKDMTSNDKIATIYEFITKNIKYSSSYLQDGLVPKKAYQTLDEKIGDCKDVASLMVLMLNKEGIEANVGLVNTYSYSSLPWLPSKMYDHAIVEVINNKDTTYLDLTSNYYPKETTGWLNSGARALVMYKDGTSEHKRLAESILTKAGAYDELDFTVTWTSSDKVSIVGKSKHQGMRGGSFREILSEYDTEKDRNESFFKSYDINHERITEVKKLKGDDLKDITKPLNVEYDIVMKDVIVDLGNMLIVNVPNFIVINDGKALEEENRKYEMNIRQINLVTPGTQTARINIPKGYSIKSIPSNVSINNKYMTASVSYKKVGSQIIVKKSVQYKSSVVKAEDYNSFVKEYKKVLEVEKSKILLEKR